MNEARPDHGRERSVRGSNDLRKRAAGLVPDGSHTGSKRPSQFVQGVSPTHIERADGCRLWDVDGNEYVECNAALGPILLGHNHPAVTAAVTTQAEDGTVFTMEHPRHVRVAERLTEMVPCAEMVQFAKNGNDVTALAAKVARAHTGRDVIARQGYHGWPDIWMADSDALDAGIPNGTKGYTEAFEYNDLESVERIVADHPDDVAAIVTTPVNLEPPENEFLEGLRAIADREGAVLVFDEILTGFRFAPGGAQEHFGVTPDLACFGKAMANGYPVSALVGRADVMRTMEDGGFFFSETYAGEAVSLAAAEATMETIASEPVHDHIYAIGEALIEGYTEQVAEMGLAEVTWAVGYPPRFSIQFSNDVETGTPPDSAAPDRLLRSLFMQEAHRRGVLFTGSHIPTYSYDDDDVEFVLEVYRECLRVLDRAIDAGDVADRVEGDLVGATLRERVGEGT